MTEFPPIGELIPHGPPMLLLDRIVAFTPEESVTCEVRIREDATFVEDGGVPAVVGIEYMAQSVAAFAGLTARADGKGVRIGLLLGCRELTLATDSFAIGDTLTVSVRRTWGESDLGSFFCKVQRGDETLATGTLTVYQGPLPEGL
jgi:predicted hotdog family 3-hydroxylacyl-ACP dehydratase